MSLYEDLPLVILQNKIVYYNVCCVNFCSYTLQNSIVVGCYKGFVTVIFRRATEMMTSLKKSQFLSSGISMMFKL